MPGEQYMVGVDEAALRALEWRLIGPFRGGRVIAVAGHPTEPATFYMGSTGGGVWKTSDAGAYWENISDGFFKRASVGAIAVAEADPNVIYVGMGESTIRSNVSHGDGVYKSTDGGRTWAQCGLAATRNIGKVRVHPQNPELVYVAALGHAHGPNPERGVYRSRDGGATWELVLYRGPEAGAVDLSMDPTNPRVLYAACWEGVHRAHELVSGGPGSGVFRSTDGGDTWEELSRKPAWPEGLLGRIGVAASGARPGRVWALVEATDGAVLRSDDYGETWQRVNEEGEVRQRPWYYMHIFADPVDPETVWVLNLNCWKSTDGGKTFAQVPGTHGDYHDLWIDPRDTRRVIQGHDGGATVTFNGGESWTTTYNQPTVEFYHVAADDQVPYRVYGAQQDNSTVSVASRSNLAAITQGDTYEVGGGESGYIVVKPGDPNIVFAGNFAGVITRYDHRTGQRQNIAAWPEESAGWGARDVKYRFQWTFPIVLSPHDPSVLYITSQHVHRSADEGHSWAVISPDLTRNDPEKQQPSGGPITVDSNGMDYYCTIFAFAESPVQAGVLWAGSDDGLVHVSRDGGKSWDDVTPPDLPTWSLVSIIEPSPFDAGAAYVAIDRHRHDDFAPYLYKTADYGRTWTKIVAGIPADEFARVVRADPARRGLLYAGTEAGLYVSLDDGAHWQPFRQNLPVVPVHDLIVKDGDLVAATHGRSFWILDDLTPLHAVTPEALAADFHLFAPRPAIRYRAGRGFGKAGGPGKSYLPVGTTTFTSREAAGPDGEKRQKLLDAGQNPPDGAVISYYLKERPASAVTLSFLDADGNEIKTFRSKPEGEELATEEQRRKETGTAEEPWVSKEAGLNRFVWNMRYPDARNFQNAIYRSSGVTGPLAPPGAYQVRMTAGNRSWTQPLGLRKDPRAAVSDDDLRAQFALLLRIRDKLSETNDAIGHIRALRGQIEGWEERSRGRAGGEAIAAAGQALKDGLATIEEELVQTRWKSSRDALTAPSKLNVKLATLLGVVGGADAAPTEQAAAVFASVAERVDAQLARLAELIEREAPRFNALVREQDLPALTVE
ncbi:MAG TPA: glycosyl hydrolase [Thermomicrobiales bacterium]|nr:glycosyl hydrolase [Thermomicrobiales bacterium]